MTVASFVKMDSLILKDKHMEVPQYEIFTSPLPTSAQVSSHRVSS